jgi:hypothetical protein
MSMTWIATGTTSGSAQGITFSSIPQTFTHLQLRCFVRNQAAAPNPDYLLGRFNGDTGTNYTNHYLHGTGSAADAGSFQIQAYSFAGPFSYTSGAYSTAGVYTNVVIDILDYTNTNKNKVTRSIGGWDSNGSGRVGIYSNLWLNTAAINSIYISTANGNEVAGSVYTLYGITTSSVTGA